MNIKQDINKVRNAVDIETKYDLADIKTNTNKIGVIEKDYASKKSIQNVVRDNNYVHTDNNFTNTYKGYVDSNKEFIDNLDYVVESGGSSIGTGYYEKYASGKLVQWGRKSVTDECKTAHGSLYRTDSNQTIYYPTEFTGEFHNIQLTPQAGFNIAYTTGSSGSRCTFYPLSVSQLNSATRYIYWLAIGTYEENEE